MADTTTTGLATASDLASGDKIMIVDVSDATMAATGTNKQATLATLYADTATLTNKTIALGSNTVSGTIAEFNTAITDATLSGNNTGDEVAASLTTAGVVELATVAETNTGTDATRAVTPDGLDGWTGSAQVATVGTVTSGNVDAVVSAASTTTAGKIEIATSAEATAASSDSLAMTPLKAQLLIDNSEAGSPNRVLSKTSKV